MIRMNLQFFGSRGTGSSLGGGSEGDNVKIAGLTDVWSYRHQQGNEPFVDEINKGAQRMERDWPGLFGTTVNTVDAVEFEGAAKTGILGFWQPGTGRLALNQNYTDIDKMNAAYDGAVKSEYHPPRGNRTGTEAVALHEMGHALT